MTANMRPLYYGTSLFLLFIIVSNSLTALFKRVWADCGNNWEYVWYYICARVHPFILSTVGTVGGGAVLYWLYGALMLFFDIYPQFNVLKRYKIQPYKNEPVIWADVKQTIKVVMTNQLCVNFPLIVLCRLTFWTPKISVPLPSFERFVCEMAFFLVVEEILFYYAHRLLHHKKLYGLVHKKHHENTAPYAITALYAHPVEHLFANLLPLLTGPFLTDCHLAVLWAWLAIATLNTLHVHSGYHIPFLPSPESHDFHHLRFNENFGVLGIMDYIHGTDIAFRKSQQYLEHRTYFSLDEYPDKHTISVPEKKLCDPSSSTSTSTEKHSANANVEGPCLERRETAST